MSMHLISDTHFYHSRICLYSSRPFANVYEMNDHFVDNWNRCIKPDDQVWHLGDFAFCSLKQLLNLLDRLNGEIHIILGNHDKVIEKNKGAIFKHGKIKSIQHYAEVKHDGWLFVLFHYGLRTWHWAYRPNTVHCYGHSHSRLPPFGRSLDVGVDSKVITSEYRPVSFKEVIKWAETIPHRSFAEETRSKDEEQE